MSLARPIISSADNEKPSQAHRHPPLAIRWTVLVLKFILGQWQVIGIGIAVLLAWLFPNVGRKGGVIESQ
jgi:hypothetical protein